MIRLEIVGRGCTRAVAVVAALSRHWHVVEKTHVVEVQTAIHNLAS